ncbi:hypothetical protein EVG20_g9912 [Dentipellis fragilis]|uniref:Uncharacterized protein n=1 Tax=Dentipellis fragilis TaxID=205917 RepID=A0A4Y9XVY3_9AGAM|nr:hypothetical protein EVG20_g9912 [Dentipellis fragilis]
MCARHRLLALALASARCSPRGKFSRNLRHFSPLFDTRQTGLAIKEHASKTLLEDERIAFQHEAEALTLLLVGSPAIFPPDLTQSPDTISGPYYPLAARRGANFLEICTVFRRVFDTQHADFVTREEAFERLREGQELAFPCEIEPGELTSSRYRLRHPIRPPDIWILGAAVRALYRRAPRCSTPQVVHGGRISDGPRSRPQRAHRVQRFAGRSFSRAMARVEDAYTIASLLSNDAMMPSESNRDVHQRGWNATRSGTRGNRRRPMATRRRPRNDLCRCNCTPASTVALVVWRTFCVDARSPLYAGSHLRQSQIGAAEEPFLPCAPSPAHHRPSLGRPTARVHLDAHHRTHTSFDDTNDGQPVPRRRALARLNRHAERDPWQDKETRRCACDDLRRIHASHHLDIHNPVYPLTVLQAEPAQTTVVQTREHHGLALSRAQRSRVGKTHRAVHDHPVCTESIAPPAHGPLLSLDNATTGGPNATSINEGGTRRAAGFVAAAEGR